MKVALMKVHVMKVDKIKSFEQTKVNQMNSIK